MRQAKNKANLTDKLERTAWKKRRQTNTLEISGNYLIKKFKI